MEMKRKQKHMSLKRSNQGFTLVELMIAMVLSLLALAAIYSTFQAQHRSYQVQSETADMQQNIRTAMYYMQREIRMAGSNPFDTMPAFGITAANSTSITFTEDIRGTNSIDPPDGDANDSEENITYALNGTNLQRTNNNSIPVVPQTVAQNIDWLDFVYLDGNSNAIPFVGGAIPVANLSQIRSVQVTIVARTRDRLLYGSTNNKQYLNQQLTVIYTAPGDNVSRRILTTTIKCRNLGI
jgi:type IV pilus assembly protein PilW